MLPSISGLRSVHDAASAACRRSPISCSGSVTSLAGAEGSAALSSPPSVPETSRTTTATAAIAPKGSEGELHALAPRDLRLLRPLALEALLAAAFLFLVPMCHGG